MPQLRGGPEWILARSRAMYVELDAPGVTRGDHEAASERHTMEAVEAYRAEFGEEPPSLLRMELLLAGPRVDKPEMVRELFGEDSIEALGPDSGAEPYPTSLPPGPSEEHLGYTPITRNPNYRGPPEAWTRSLAKYRDAEKGTASESETEKEER